MANATPVLLISDATGSLGQHVLETIFTQFPDGAFRLEVMNFVDTEQRLAECLKRLARFRGIVIHATVYPTFKRRIRDTASEHRLPAYDLTGPIVAFLVASSGHKPQVSPGKLHSLTPDYFRRIGAIEFTIEHDDGAGLRTLRDADVVLTGVSRTTKTPTSMVLATRGFRTANVPLVHGLAPPKELLAMKPDRVVCLTCSVQQLSAFRSQRVQDQLGTPVEAYADARAIREELLWAKRMADQRGWKTLDVTDRAVEETAARVISLVGADPEPHAGSRPARRST